jgi:hypothetical protein
VTGGEQQRGFGGATDGAKVSAGVFEAPCSSIHGALRTFGPEVTCRVCVNPLPLPRARALTGSAPSSVDRLDVTPARAPLLVNSDPARADGVRWHFAPSPLAVERPELHLDNDWIAPRSELEEPGRVRLSCSRHLAPHVVEVDEVAISGPVPVHRQALGRWGAHFVGLSAKRLPWLHQAPPGETYLRRQWRWLRPHLYAALEPGADHDLQEA